MHFFSITGEVSGVNRWSDTRITGSGGGQVMRGTKVDPIRVSSTTVDQQEFFLQDDSGKTHSMRFSGSIVPIADGHEVEVVYAGRQQGSGFPVGIANRTTRQSTALWANFPIVAGKTSALLTVFILLLFAMAGFAAFLIWSAIQDSPAREFGAMLERYPDTIYGVAAAGGLALLASLLTLVAMRSGAAINKRRAQIVSHLRERGIA
ncbi:MAG: hypothetical protein RKE49_10185 [Oceanicaulis sp.]